MARIIPSDEVNKILLDEIDSYLRCDDHVLAGCGLNRETLEYQRHRILEDMSDEPLPSYAHAISQDGFVDAADFEAMGINYSIEQEMVEWAARQVC